VTTTKTVSYDPYDAEVARDPYPLYRRLRDEAPIYYSEEKDFWAISRHADVADAFLNRDVFISSHGTALDIIKSGMDLPPGTVLMEDPPTHTIHRKLLSRMFTPKSISALEPRVREFCAELLDPLVGSDGFDLIAEVAKKVPTRVISMLVGIPEADEESVRDRFGTKGQRTAELDEVLSGDTFAEYLDWRVDHPSDDIMTQLLHVEFEDETGTHRHLTREEILAYVNIVALAGNETTRLLIGWAVKALAEHPDQRRLLVQDRALLPNAVEECLRYESPTLGAGRYVARDIELHGTTIPAGSAVSVLIASANRDERTIDDPDRFDIRRGMGNHMTFGFGPHYCLGHALAKIETRLVLDEILTRFPDWEVDMAGAEFRHSGAEIRGWEALPIVLP
jgi:cytochrome P450